MIKLNLLPPQEKKILSLEEIQRWISFYGVAVLGLLFVFIVLLMVAWLFIMVQLDWAKADLEKARQNFNSQGFKEQENKVNQINQQLGKISRAQNDYRSYLDVLAKISTLIPANIRLNAFSLNEQKEIRLNGFTPQRELIIQFRERLEKSGFFKDIESPLSNLTQQTNITFDLKFKIND